MKKYFTLIAAFALAASSFSAKAQMQQLPNDPAVRKGQLENGLTYYIRHNDKPANRAEFYLATNVGAIQETPDQDGLAHFLEHMCFNGTKNFPGKGILNWLQSIGASFGGNVNASTGIDQTQYMLNNIPLVRESVVDTCLLILHDYSHFVTNDPEELDKERPVIIEERRSRRNAQWRLFERSLPYIYGETKYSTCTLIGSQENLETFKPESIVNFYQTWYRPDMQAVVVVGDIDVDKVEATIKRTWADIPAAENPKAKDKITMKDFDEPRVGVLTDPEMTLPQIEIL
ncbi:MAG: insulinase family protein, partial [Bacteroidales bacterium]|nr:insulinase family protein [Bacteroidales bacterium]